MRLGRELDSYLQRDLRHRLREVLGQVPHGRLVEGGAHPGGRGQDHELEEQVRHAEDEPLPAEAGVVLERNGMEWTRAEIDKKYMSLELSAFLAKTEETIQVKVKRM